VPSLPADHPLRAELNAEVHARPPESLPIPGRVSYVGMFADALDFVKAKLFASILAPGAYEAGDVAKSREILEQARRAGHDAVST
jgi:hypothetical protein